MSDAAAGALGALRVVLPAGLRRAARSALHAAVDAVPALARARDARALRRRMRAALGYEPDLRNPRTHNERLAHKILHDRDPLLVRTSDKIAVRDFVAERIGPEYLIPLIGTYDRAADIPWDALPDRFVLKANHGSGTNLIVREKAAVDRAEALRVAEEWLADNHYRWTGEWAYSRIRPRLLAEALLEDAEGKAPPDYKFYVFHGRPRIVDVHIDRFGPGYRYLQRDAETLGPLPFKWGDLVAPEEDCPTYLPAAEVRAMAALAARLGAGFDHVRVDLYLSGGRIWFGELTHYTSNACAPFFPDRCDRVLGDLWVDPGRSLATTGAT
ncbi:ATP-grasp fold amidoligase family protein [Falsiroseomonas sp. HW251]|uniref:ATP-grasp fold amidoligase family protein n=1 Tax=Falsiroseomonas sp. HW251 TaxID=3390998 RepID=UPI003D323843